jgi:hypothetical protein
MDEFILLRSDGMLETVMLEFFQYQHFLTTLVSRNIVEEPFLRSLLSHTPRFHAKLSLLELHSDKSLLLSSCFILHTLKAASGAFLWFNFDTVYPPHCATSSFSSLPIFIFTSMNYYWLC